MQIAFAIVLVDYILNPKKMHIKIKEEILQRKIKKYLVCFCKYLKYMLYNIINNEIFFLFRTKWKNMIYQKMKQKIQKRKPKALKMLKSKGIYYLRNS
jgi:hypothetical protein